MEFAGITIMSLFILFMGKICLDLDRWNREDARRVVNVREEEFWHKFNMDR